MKPFYFGSSDKPLFGIHHAAASGAPRRREGVVLCYPFGREYLRAHRAMRELAQRLSAEGFHVLRFDYYGSGDSSGMGEQASLAQWLSDVDAAVEEIRNASGANDVSLVGVRLGAAIAALAARDTGGLARLVLWDPVVNGEDYLGEITEAHSAWSRAHGIPDASDGGDERDGPRDVLGFPLPRELAREVAGIDLAGLDAVVAKRVLLVADDLDPALDRVKQKLGTAARVEFHRVPASLFWLRQEGINRALVPSAALSAIATFFTEATS